MIETTWFTSAAWIALLASLAALLLTARPWRPVTPGRAAAAWTLAVFAGFFLAGAIHLLVKGERPFPPRESVHFLIFYLAPFAAAAQLIAGLPRMPGWARFLIAAVVVAATPPLLLQSVLRNSSSETLARNLKSCLDLALGMGAGWLLLHHALRTSIAGRGAWLAIFLVAGATGLTLLASGSMILGQLGLSLSLTMLGAVLASRGLRDPQSIAPGLGLAYVLLAGLLMQGQFMAELNPTRALALALTPAAAVTAGALVSSGRWRWPAIVAMLVVATVLAAAIAVPALLQAMHDAEAAGPASYGY